MDPKYKGEGSAIIATVFQSHLTTVQNGNGAGQLAMNLDILYCNVEGHSQTV